MLKANRQASTKTTYVRYQNALLRLAVVVLLLQATVVQARNITKVDSVRHWISPNKTQLVFSTNQRVKYNVFKLENPSRIVIDLQDVAFKNPFPQLNLSGSDIKQIRNASHNGDDMRIVLDMAKAADFHASMLSPNDYYGYRFIVDINVGDAEKPKVYKSIKDLSQNVRDVIIAIDAGHGGEDPGAIGARGIKEKTVVLQIAKKLYELVQKEPGMRPVMIRDGDYFLSLRQRIQQARKERADLFVSIHADAAENRRARGSSVYVLSQKGATSEAARWLADSQNKSDLIGGVDLDVEDDTLKSVLLDLTQNATLAASTELGGLVLGELSSVGSLHIDHVEKAGFVVLKSPDVPSILVESGFISHHQEERLLANRQHQFKLARSVIKGIRKYFEENALPGTRFAKVPAGEPLAKAERSYTIQIGDTLTGIAERYNISRYSLKRLNNLVSDHIEVGQVLRIPLTSGG